MKRVARNIVKFWSEERSLTAFLVLLIVEIFVIAPMQFSSGPVFRIVNNMIFILLLLVGLLTMTKRKELQAVASMFVVLAVATRLARLFFGIEGLEVLDGFLLLLSCIGFLLIVLWQVFREGPVTMHRIQGAVAGYLLISVIFSVAYSLVEFLQQGSFHLSHAEDQLLIAGGMNQSFYYFSVITLTTTGYGDITAVSHFARSLVMMETLIGQLYPAILIARLVSLYAEAKRHGKQS
jgi:hypothetical protein